ncbi:MAG: hypothetical protein OJK14_09285 [Achromobacter sp.]|uniref:hypothetical protein n=1 Tax=Achromobacter sp. TaxID=134375 RepID=UPI002586E582|nr:hypothetical protein [Achromobacter sp.]MCW0207282.1 hypothetical protein [Achromobacter sp.]
MSIIDRDEYLRRVNRVASDLVAATSRQPIAASPGDGALASVVNLAAMQIDAALPTIRAGAEALGNTDLSRTMWMVAHLLEGLHEKLEAAEMEG